MRTLPTNTWIPYLTGDEIPKIPEAAVFWIDAKSYHPSVMVHTLCNSCEESVQEFRQHARYFLLLSLPLVEQAEWEKDFELYESQLPPELSLKGVENLNEAKRVYRDAWQSGYSAAIKHHEEDL